MRLIGQLHLAAAVLAMFAGAAVLLAPGKGGRRHRRLGWLYAGAMLALNATALMIYRLFGGFGPFHAFALISLVGLVLGVRAGRQARSARLSMASQRRAQVAEHHYFWMTWSYVGLIAAFASETITRLPALRPVLGGGRMFGIAVAVATLVIVAIGSQWIRRGAAGALAPFRAAPATRD